MDMFEELRAWAEKWNIPHAITEDEECIRIGFDSVTYEDPMFSYNKTADSFAWYGGD